MRPPFIIPLYCLLLLGACGEPTPVPKPRAYPRVDYPAKNYRLFNEGSCDFTFDMPEYAVVEHDTTFFDKKPDSDCWFNLLAPSLNAIIYCSYYPVTSRARFEELRADAYTLAQKHNIRASYIEEMVIHRPDDRVHGVLFNIEGQAASAYQFFLTDSTRHFVRGALYFKTQARPDSLAPVVDFMRKDVDRLAATLKWAR